MNALILSFFLALTAQAGFGFPNLKIRGGTDATPEEFPHQAQLEFLITDCGGVILDERHILTTATCAANYIPGFKASAYVGSEYKYQGVKVEISGATIHPDYKPGGSEADIAVLKLNETLSLSDNVNKAVLADKDFKEEGNSTATLSGFGKSSEEGEQPGSFQKVDLDIITTKDCQNIYDEYRVTDDVFCAGPLDGSKDACYGDTGSGLVQNGKVIAIAANFLDCGHGPGRYVRVSQYRDFIDGALKL